jgi:hypothetical protein
VNDLLLDVQAIEDARREGGRDRLLIATAIGLDCPLVTYDDGIRRCARTRGKQYGFAVL